MAILSALVVCAAVLACTASPSPLSMEEVRMQAPTFAKLMDLSNTAPAVLAAEIMKSPLAAFAPTFELTEEETAAKLSASGLPIVVTHGMGDSCFNPGMKSITEAAGKHAGVYSVCIPTGNTQVEDTINAFLLNMDDSVDVFAAKVRNDTTIMAAGKFNAFGLSQGNSLIRGYIQRYNDPPVVNYIAIHSTVSGVAGFPRCAPSGAILGPICTAIAEVLGDLAYEEVIQKHLFQADYFRDPLKINTTQYAQNSQLADWDNVGAQVHPEYNANFAKTARWAMVKALKDTMVWPNEGEWWGLPDPDPAEWTNKNLVQPMNQTDLYIRDTFGLRTADRARKIFFETTPGDHLQFTEAELFGWIDKYF